MICDRQLDALVYNQEKVKKKKSVLGQTKSSSSL